MGLKISVLIVYSTLYISCTISKQNFLHYVSVGFLIPLSFPSIRLKARQRRSKYILTTTPGTSYGMRYRGEPIMEFTLMNENTTAEGKLSILVHTLY